MIDDALDAAFSDGAEAAPSYQGPGFRGVIVVMNTRDLSTEEMARRHQINMHLARKLPVMFALDETRFNAEQFTELADMIGRLPTQAEASTWQKLMVEQAEALF